MGASALSVESQPEIPALELWVANSSGLGLKEVHVHLLASIANISIAPILKLLDENVLG